jgi:hypothetical protein
MTQAKEQLIQEIEQAPDSLIEEVLNYLLFTKSRFVEKSDISKSELNKGINSLVGLFFDEPDQMNLVMSSIESDRDRDRKESLE